MSEEIKGRAIAQKKRKRRADTGLARTHGQSAFGELTPEYRAWRKLRERCLNRNDKSYADYGGRGIQVLWGSFEAFLAEIGPRPGPEYSVDRYPDQNGHYGPGNCRWATQKQQQRNKRNNRVFLINGESAALSEWVERYAVPYQLVYRRVTRFGWPIEKALTTPRREGKWPTK